MHYYLNSRVIVLFYLNSRVTVLFYLTSRVIVLLFQMTKKLDKARKKAETVNDTVDISEKEKMSKMKA